MLVLIFAFCVFFEYSMVPLLNMSSFLLVEIVLEKFFELSKPVKIICYMLTINTSL